MAKDETPPTEENAQTTKEDALGVFQAFSGWSCTEFACTEILRQYASGQTRRTNDLAVENFHIRGVAESTPCGTAAGGTASKPTAGYISATVTGHRHRLGSTLPRSPFLANFPLAD